jgi:hypothetical protein
MSIESTPGEVQGQHVILTGPIRGTVTKADGTEVDVSAPVIAVDSIEEAEEISFLIGEHFVAVGHPDDVEVDEKGAAVQRPFVHNFDKKKFGKHPSKFSGKAAGTPRKG